MRVTVRDATATDVQAIVDLLKQLGHPISTEGTQHQLALLSGTGHDRVLIAEADGVVLGVLSLHWTPLLHRDRPLGRIMALVADEAARGQGLGRRLLARAERVLREAGCSAVEVTSNVRRAEAHDFYRGLGYAQPSAYFRHSLDDLPEEGQPDSQKERQDLWAEPSPSTTSSSTWTAPSPTRRRASSTVSTSHSRHWE